MQAQLSTNENAVHRVVLPFKDQKSAEAVKRQLSDPSKKNRSHSSTCVQESQCVKASRSASPNHLELANNALCTIVNMICVMQGMSATPTEN